MRKTRKDPEALAEENRRDTERKRKTREDPETLAEENEKNAERMRKTREGKDKQRKRKIE